MTPGSVPAAPAAAVSSPSTATPAQTQTPAQADKLRAGKGEIAPADFLLMLGQLAGAVAPASRANASSGSSLLPTSTPADDAADDGEGSDVLGALAITLPVTIQDLMAAAKIAGASELQASRGVAAASVPGVDVQVLKDAMAALAASNGDAHASFDGALAPQSPIEPQQPTRAASTVDSLLSRPVHSPVGSPAWADEIGSRLTVMVDHGKHTASLRLSPEHLGPLEVRISVRDDQASVWFGAAHADTRAAIEHALPRLRELFSAQGLSLADAGVFREPPREHAASSGRASNGTRGSESEDASPAPAAVSLSVGLLDAYA